jgi:hypothetical protein
MYDPDLPEMTDDEAATLTAMSEMLGGMREVLFGPDGSPATLRMATATFRAAADVLDRIADRWEEAKSDA